MKKTRVVRGWAYLDDEGQIQFDEIYRRYPKKEMSTDAPFIEVEIRPITKRRKV